MTERRLQAVATLAVLVMTCCVLPSQAITADFALVDADQSVSNVIFSRFGLEQGGVVKVSAAIDGEHEPRVYLSLFRSSVWESHWDTLQGTTADETELCLLPSQMRVEIVSSVNVTYSVPARDQYTLVALACRGTGVTVDGVVTITNPSQGLSRQHLSLEYTPSPTLAIGFALVYASMLLLFGAYVWFHSEHATKIHYLVVGAVFMRLLDLVITAHYFNVFGSTGELGTTAASLRQLATSAGDVVFLLALFLLARGWTLPGADSARTITVCECIAIGMVFGVFMLVGTLKAFCHENPRLCSAFLLAEYLVRSLIMLGIIVAMNFNIQGLRQDVLGPWAPSSVLTYRTLGNLKSFRWTFLAYLLLPTVLLIVKITVLSWRFEWLATLLDELLLLYVFLHVLFTFRPLKPMDFSSVGQHEEGVQDECLSDDEDDHLQLMHNGTPRHALASSGLSLFSRNERRQRRISPAEVVLRESANDLRASNASAML